MRVCYHPDGTRVLTGSSLGKIEVCAAADGATTATLEVSATEDEVYGMEMLTSELLAVGSGNTAQLWDLDRATRLAHTTFEKAENGIHFGGPGRNPNAMAFVFSLAARGRALCMALSDGTVRLLDSQTLRTIGALDEHARRGTPAFGVAISPTTPQIASADQDGTVLLWDMRVIGHGPLAETCHHAAVHSLAFVAGVDGTPAELLVTGDAEQRLIAHETRTALGIEGSARVLSPVLCVKAAPASAAASAPRLATAGGSGGIISDASISLWQVAPRTDTYTAEEPAKASKKQKRDAADDADETQSSSAEVCEDCCT